MKGYQFSLRTLLVAVAAVGIGAALWTAEPSWQLGVVEGLLLVLVPATAIALAVHSTGTATTWWIGIATASAAVAILAFLHSTTLLGYDPIIVKSPLVNLMQFARALSFGFRSAMLAWAFAPVVGLLCVFTHWLFIRSPEPKA
jgi:hypothetical protein